MIETTKPNPFQVLGLPTNATNKEIVERGRELYDTAETDEQQQLYRWAKEQLLSNPQVRVAYELFEAPGAQYENPEVENFIRKYKRNPVTPDSLTKDAAPITKDDFNLGKLIQLLLEDMLIVPNGDITVAIQQAPFSPEPQLSLEVRNVLFG